MIHPSNVVAPEFKPPIPRFYAEIIDNDHVHGCPSFREWQATSTIPKVSLALGMRREVIEQIYSESPPVLFLKQQMMRESHPTADGSSVFKRYVLPFVL